MTSESGDSRRLAKILAFLQRAFWIRPVHGSQEWGVDTDRRADKWLAVLDSPSGSLNFRVKLENLLRECDLFMEEEALKPSCRDLQGRIFELADQFEALAWLRDHMFVQPPLVKLFSAMLNQANADGAVAIKIDWTEIEYEISPGAGFSREARRAVAKAAKAPSDPSLDEDAPDKPRKMHGLSISFLRSDEWAVAMNIPANLKQPLRGVITRTEGLGYERYRPYLRHSEKLPERLRIEWRPDSVLLWLNRFEIETPAIKIRSA